MSKWSRVSSFAPLAASICVLSGCEIRVDSTEDGGSDAPSVPAGSSADPWTEVPGPPSWSAPPSSPPAAPNPAPARPYAVEPMRELVVIDPAVVGSERANNSVRGAAWSFRTQLEWLAGSEQSAAPFAEHWLRQWATVTEVGPYAAPVTRRAAVQRLLIDPWRGAATGSSAMAGSGAAYGVPARAPALEHFPFRLIAIVNRLDLHAGACSGAPGELRFVYAALDHGTARALEMTVIIEIPYPASRSAVSWARSWHELSRPGDGALYAERLEALTREVLDHANPLSVRVRSNERALAEPQSASWELREFHVESVESERHLSQVALAHTPREDAVPSRVDAHVALHATSVHAGAVELPPELRAGAARVSAPSFSWPSATLSEPLRVAFSRETCNGCHGGDTPTLPFQHIAPDDMPTRPARLSRFLRDPAAASDELRRRSRVLEALLLTSCDGAEPSDYSP